MNAEKLFQSVAFLLKKNGGKMDYYNLIKECYIADRRSIDAVGVPVTGDSYVSMNRGPVLKGLYSFIKGSNPDSVMQNTWNQHFSVEDHKISLADSSIAKGEEKPIPIQSVMRAVGISEQEITLLLSEQQSYEKEAELFRSN